MLPGADHQPDSVAAVVRNNLLKALLSLVLLGALTAFLVANFRSELDEFTTWTFQHIGLPGIVALIFLTDAFVSPFPPDSVLILLARSEHHASWPWLLPLIGLVSTCGGYVGYGGGRLLSLTQWGERVFGKMRRKAERRIATYGVWAVVLGALTPIPFSMTCWTAGLMHVPFRSIIWPCLLRVPRYVLYYVAIAYSAQAF